MDAHRCANLEPPYLYPTNFIFDLLLLMKLAVDFVEEKNLLAVGSNSSDTYWVTFLPINPDTGYIAEYLGCFPQTAMNGTFISDASMNATGCQQQCNSTNFKYSGLTGSSCYCSNSIDASKLTSESFCGQTCPGNPSMKCGGSGYLNIYSSMSFNLIKSCNALF